ncbi:hypothetical protein GOV13_04950 [Candidatus Pacearchaeota archaeon]|nr:hypothetical protein [Candidatus Pacearchaeota archaeon]
MRKKSCMICGYYHYAKYLCESHWQKGYYEKQKHPDEPFQIGDYFVHKQGQPGTIEGRITGVHYRNYWISTILDNGKQKVFSKWELRKIHEPFQEIKLPPLLT